MTSVSWKFLPGQEHSDPDPMITVTAIPEDGAGAPRGHLCGQLCQLPPPSIYSVQPAPLLPLRQQNFKVPRWYYVSTPVLSDKLWPVKPVMTAWLHVTDL